MGLIDLLNHLLNFAAPAVVVAGLTALVACRFVFTKPGMPGFRGLAIAASVTGLMVLALGSWMFGRDGKMATYAVMVVVCATTQWVMARSWKA